MKKLFGVNPLTIAIIIAYPWLWYLMSRIRKTQSWLTSGQPVNFAALYVLAILVSLSLITDFGKDAVLAGGAFFLGLIGWLFVIFLRRRGS